MDRRVTVSYEAVPNTSDWDKIKDEVISQLPLKNLHWKSTRSGTSRSIRTIQSLQVNFKPLSSFAEDKPPVSLLERPYLHLLFVLCEDNEVYRATVRSQIREWLDSVIARQNQEWLIVHVSTGRSAGSKFYQRKGSVVDKIRADFNTGKRDRCVQVAQSVSAEDPTTWAEFSTKVKEGIVSTFDANVGLYEEDVRKADSQRQLEGWQYTSFFLQKEALADCFEAMNLIEDALIQYDELEASFFQTLKENNMAWFGKIGGLAPGDDALALLSTLNKPYRALIMSNDISIFDFRIYLFARQAALLSQLGRITEIARRGAYFISTFARTLRENQEVLGRNFVESWTYSASLNIADECQRWTESDSVDPAVTQSVTAVKAELLELARKQLDKIGIEAGHLPLIHPFSMSLNEIVADRVSPTSSVPTTPTRPPVSRKDLLDAIASRDVFDKLYIDLTNRSITAYQASHRKRCSLKLHASLAALEDHRERPISAQKLYSHLPAHYVDLRWVKIESSLLSQCTRLQAQLDMNKERLLSTLALIRAGVELGSKGWSLELGSEESGMHLSPVERRMELARKLMGDVYELSGKLSKDFAAIAFPTFSMRLGSDRGAIAADEDGVTVSLLIRSFLPCTLKIDEVRLKFATAEGEQVWFTSGASALSPGETHVTLFCPTAISGRLALELSQIRFSRIIFQYSHRPTPTRPSSDTRSSASQPFVHFPHDPQALDIHAELPIAIHLDQNRRVVLCIATGRNQIVKGLLKVKTLSSDTTFDLGAAQLVQGTARLKFVSEDGTLLIEDVPAASTIKIELPILGVLRDPTVEISVVAEYFTSKRPTTRRSLRRSVIFPIALPLAVNVQDFFRKDCLLSKFSVTTDGLRGLRLKSADLEGVQGITVKPCRPPDAGTITVLPSQTANFLFKIVRHPSHVTDLPLRLKITYCSVYEDFLANVKHRTLLAIKTAAFEDDSSWLLDAVVSEIEAVASLHSYGLHGRLTHLLFDEDAWAAKVTSHYFAAERQAAALEVARKCYEDLVRPPPLDLSFPWRTLTIPVELPSLNILNLVKVVPAFATAEVGEAIPFELFIRPTFAWSASPLATPLLLSYDVTAISDDWMISGRKKGEFAAEDGFENKVSLTLIPLRPGTLFLPSVAIRPKSFFQDRPISCETQHLNAAATVECLPVSFRATFSIDLA